MVQETLYNSQPETLGDASNAAYGSDRKEEHNRSYNEYSFNSEAWPETQLPLPTAPCLPAEPPQAEATPDLEQNEINETEINPSNGDPENIYALLLSNPTIVTPLLHTINDITIHLQDNERSSVSQTLLNEIGLMDNQLLQQMNDIPLDINGQTITLPEILNGGYAIDSVPTESMFSIVDSNKSMPTQVHIQGEKVTAIHPQNVTSTIGSAFGPRPVRVFTEPWRQANDMLHQLSKDERKRQFYVSPPEGPVMSEKAIFTGVEKIFNQLHTHLSSIDSKDKVNLDNDPDIYPWLNSVSTYNSSGIREHRSIFSKGLPRTVTQYIPRQNPPLVEDTIESVRLISQPELYGLRLFSYATPRFSDPEYNNGITELMLDYVDKWTDHYYKVEFMDTLRRNRSFSKKLFIDTSKKDTFTIAAVTTDPAAGYHYPIKI